MLLLWQPLPPLSTALLILMTLCFSTDNSPDGEDVQACTFGAIGTYQMSVTATSLLENKTCYHTIAVIYPVTEEYDFVAENAPIDYEFAFNCK